MVDDGRGQEIWLRAHAARFRSTCSEGQSRLTEPPTGQKAKMIAGELYLATDPELVAEDLRAQELLYRFNLTRPGSDARACGRDRGLLGQQYFSGGERESDCRDPLLHGYGPAALNLGVYRCSNRPDAAQHL